MKPQNYEMKNDSHDTSDPIQGIGKAFLNGIIEGYNQTSISKIVFWESYRYKAADILLDRLKTSEPSDTLSIVLSLKELFESTYNESIEIETNKTIEENTDKRHWKSV